MSDKAFEMTEAQLFKKWHSERMGHPIGVHLGINAVNELEQEHAKTKEQLHSLFERVSGCEVSEFDSEQVNYLADMIEGQMDANEGTIEKLIKEKQELIKALYDLSEWKPVKAYDNALYNAKELLAKHR